MSAAITKYIAAFKGEPHTIIRNAKKAYRTKRPTGARHAAVPNMHDMLDLVAHMPLDTEKNTRLKLICLLALLGQKRPSDIVRLWRHDRSTKLRTQRLDTPPWARRVRTEAATVLHDLGLLPRDNLMDDEFIIFSFRAHLPKQSTLKTKKYADWIDLIENRFFPQLCPVRTLARYYFLTDECKIATELRLSKLRTISHITDDRGANPIAAAPLIISLPARNASMRKGLRSSTISNRIRDALLTPLNLHADFVPYVTRCMSASYKIAYGLPVATAMHVANNSSEQAFLRHYRVAPLTPIDKSRLHDVGYHDWLVPRAHQLTKSSLPALGNPSARPHTRDDEAIAQALAIQPRRRSKRKR